LFEDWRDLFESHFPAYEPAEAVLIGVADRQVPDLLRGSSTEMIREDLNKVANNPARAGKLVQPNELNWVGGAEEAHERLMN